MKVHAKTTALARIAAVTPQRGRRVWMRMGLAVERLGKVGARSMSGEPEIAPEEKTAVGL